MRRALATSCGNVPSIRNRRNGFAQTGPSSSVGAVLSGVLVLVPSDGLADATYARSVASLPSSSSMHFWSIYVMPRLYSCLLITVNALDRRLMRRASAMSCGSIPSIRNRRNGFVQTGPSSSVGTALSGVLVLVSSDGLSAATCARSVESSPSTTASGATACTLMDL